MAASIVMGIAGGDRWGGLGRRRVSRWQLDRPSSSTCSSRALGACSRELPRRRRPLCVYRSRPDPLHAQGWRVGGRSHGPQPEYLDSWLPGGRCGRTVGRVRGAALNYHDYPAFAFQNLQTSQVLENDPASSTTSLDLNSPQLAQSICRPLTLPPVVSAVGSGWGSLTFPDDGFAIASGNDGAYLERCGSHLHEFLTQTRAVDGESSYLCPYLECPPVNNSREIVWPANTSLAFGPRGINGIFTTKAPTGPSKPNRG